MGSRSSNPSTKVGTGVHVGDPRRVITGIYSASRDPSSPNLKRVTRTDHQAYYGARRTFMALARRLIQRPRRASQKTRRRYGPRATVRGEHDHMGSCEADDGSKGYVSPCMQDRPRVVTAPLAP
jgi:hypothetical protein